MNANKIKLFSFFLSFFLIVIVWSCTQTGEFVRPTIHWEYENPNWAQEGFSECSQKVQSPIDIDTTKTVKADLADIQFQYSNFLMKIIDNGHTVQVNNNGVNQIVINGTVFKFKQFHFHHKSEHKIASQAADMELHLVHEDEVTKNLAVLGIMLESGVENPFIKKVWDNFPSTKSNEITTSTTINLSDILPSDKRYYTYTGSLTTPPCSQGLQWIVFKERVRLSSAQIQAFSKIYENNARPVQPLNNRIVNEKK